MGDSQSAHHRFPSCLNLSRKRDHHRTAPARARKTRARVENPVSHSTLCVSISGNKPPGHKRNANTPSHTPCRAGNPVFFPPCKISQKSTLVPAFGRQISPKAALRAPNQTQSPDKAGLRPALSVPVPRLRRGLEPSPSPGLGSNQRPNQSKSVQNWPNQSPVPPFGRQISPKVPIMPACGAAKSVSSAALRPPNQS